MAKIITLMHHKGGVGKSTLTLNLANNLDKYSKVCIVDFDTQGSLLKTKDIINIEVFSYENFIYKNKINLSSLYEKFDYIFIDTPPYITPYFHQISDISDVIILPLKAGAYDFLSINDTLKVVNENNKRKCIAIFNMIIKNSNMMQESKKELEKLNIPIAKTYISNLVSYSNSLLNNGLNDKAQIQINDLTTEIINKILDS